jgi:hypothetical protein
MPGHLPAPQVKVGWNAENVVQVLMFGTNEIPIPFDTDQVCEFVLMLLSARQQVRMLQKQAEQAEAGNGDLLAEAQANVGAAVEAPEDLKGDYDDDVDSDLEETEDLTYQVSTTEFEQPPAAEAVADSPVD